MVLDCFKFAFNFGFNFGLSQGCNIPARDSTTILQGNGAAHIAKGQEQHLAEQLTHTCQGIGSVSIATITITLHGWYATGDSTVPFVDGGVASTASIIMPLRFPIAAAASDSKVCKGRQPLDYCTRCLGERFSCT